MGKVCVGVPAPHVPPVALQGDAGATSMSFSLLPSGFSDCASPKHEPEFAWSDSFVTSVQLPLPELTSNVAGFAPHEHAAFDGAPLHAHAHVDAPACGFST